MPSRVARRDGFWLAHQLCHAWEGRGAPSPTDMVAVAQLVRAPGCGPGGRGFKSPRSPSFPRGSRPGDRLGFTFGRASSSIWQSNGLLIRRFWVRVPGGAPGQAHQVRGSKLEISSGFGGCACTWGETPKACVDSHLHALRHCSDSGDQRWLRRGYSRRPTRPRRPVGDAPGVQPRRRTALVTARSSHRTRKYRRSKRSDSYS